MAFKATFEQNLAITEKGNILVSAAAGSGKTAVLVERVISMLTDKTSGVNADSLLIVTFTNAAANEMRSRIEKRLDQECRRYPNDTGLLLQKHLLNNAKICTIDSFCIDLVRENFDKLDISPDFKIVDGITLNDINQNVIYGIINRYLEEKNPVFEELLDIIGAEFDESNFANTLLDIYNYSRQLPFPEKWYESLSEFYKDGQFDSDNIWYKQAFLKAEKICISMRESLSNAIDLISCNQKAVDGYLGIFTNTLNSINLLLDALRTNDWDAFYIALSKFSPIKLPTVRGVNDISDIVAAKDIYKFITTKSIKTLKNLFYADFTFINLQFKKINKPIKLLVEILKELDQKIFEEYKISNQFTFHNTEHLALKLLCKYENGEILANEDSLELLNRFSEVMVDEYQDTNDLQDMLFYVLSGFEKKLFAVGDVKQSIYGFRGANPLNFLQKKKRYIDVNEALENEPKKIILGNNFRTKDKVCEYINYFFNLFMQNETGDINYSDGEELIPSAEYLETEYPSVEYNIIETGSSNKNSLVLEAVQIANIIKDIVNGKECIKQDEKTLRKANYGDFTILLRSMANKAPILVNELKKQGIPVSLNLENFADSIEVSTFLSLLKVIDNPQTDIELLTLMMSPIFNFSPDEMAQIRAEKPEGNLYSAVIFASKNGNKHAKEFLSKLEEYRLYSITLSLDKLISKLLIVTEYLNVVSAMEDGERRKNNLLLLCNYAVQFSLNNRSINAFVKYILTQSQKGIKSAIGSNSGDTVKVMSIHASKGLQFPICIIAGTSSKFNDQEARENTVVDSNFGIGFKYFDEDDKTKYTTIAREIIIENSKYLSLQEELRLFYVALTRTQDRLIMISSFNNIEKAVEGYKNLLLASNSNIDYNLFSRTKSYADWLMLAALLHPNGNKLRSGSSIISVDDRCEFNISLIDGENLLESQPDNDNEKISVDFEKVNKIKENLAFCYPFAEILNIESKTSASLLTKTAENNRYAFSEQPAFLSDDGITAAGKGTAIHKVMQFFDFSKKNDIDSEIDRLYEWQFISDVERDSLNKNDLQHFFESDIFERIENSPLVKREMRFLSEVSARQIDKKLDSRFENEKIIIQGAVDICFIEDDGVVILDFKTDRVDDINDLRDSYAEQLNIYAIACEKIFQKPVKEKLIYSFKFGRTIRV